MSGRGEDDRIWGSLFTDLASCGDVRRRVDLADLADLDAGGDVVLVASGRSTSAAVHAAAAGKAQALILLSPGLAELLPDVEIDVDAVVRDVIQDLGWLREAVAMGNPDDRRRAFADGAVIMAGNGLPAEDVSRLRKMYYEHADVALTPEPPSERPQPYAETLKTLDIPVLYVGVRENDLAVATLKALLRRTRRGELLLLDTPTTSYPWLAKPEETAAAITDFLTRVPSRP